MGSRFHLLLVLLLTFVPIAVADSPFDLTGPPIQVKVVRNGVTLPIAEVPNLAAGDRLHIHPELPQDQAAHYLLIVTFLRGSTNPPPDNWFTKAELWNKKFRDEGLFATVPEGAQQAVIFLAPETTGDFSTLRSAVRGRPGSFVRAVQDLDQASLDRARLDTYLASVNKVSEDDPAKLHDVSILLARSLSIRLEDDCFKKPVDQQAACLTQKAGDLVLNDGHSQSVVGALTNGPSSDLIGQLTYTPQAGSGYFSPYVGAIVDMGRILDSLHTAQYQYIPALSLPKDDILALKLNNPPSFHNPKSVIVVALPAVRKQQQPPLRPANAEMNICIQKTPLVLQTVGAPLVFSSQLLHNPTLHIETKAGKFDLPLTVDPARGGFIVDPDALAKTTLDSQGNSLKGIVNGKWGFDPFTGPTFNMVSAKETEWSIPNAETANLMEGGAHVLHLHSAEAACVDHVALKNSIGAELTTSWKLEKADQLQLSIPAASTRTSGPVTLEIKQAGLSKEETLPLRIFAKPGELTAFTLIPGDSHGTLKGSGARNATAVEVKDAKFQLDTSGDASEADNQLRFITSESKSLASLQPHEKLTAQVTLNDGRKLDVPVTVESLRPRVKLLSKAVQLGTASQSSVIHLANNSELPTDAQLSFAVKAEQPATFPLSQRIEIATADEAFHLLLSTQDGSLTLQDPQTVVGHFNPAKSFGPSAFGPLMFRPIAQDNVAGEWKPLAKLVREPTLQGLTCPDDPNMPCALTGNNLFLLNSVAADANFTNPAVVPEGFLESTLQVPHPTNGTLYIKLRDDPSDVNQANVPSGPPVH